MKSQEILDVLREELKKVAVPDGVAALYAYGSIVRDTFRNDSDIDIAMLPSHDTNDMERLRLMSQVEAIIGSALHSQGIHREISVLDMRGKYVSLQLLYNVITRGIVLYQSTSEERISFEHAVTRDYFDFVPYLLSIRKRKYGDLYKKVRSD